MRSRGVAFFLVLLFTLLLAACSGSTGGDPSSQTPETPNNDNTGSGNEANEEEGATGKDDVDSWPKAWIFPTSASGSASHAAAVFISAQLQKEYHVSVTPMEGRSTANILGLAEKEEIVMTYGLAPDIQDAYNGTGEFSQPIKDLRILTGIYPMGSWFWARVDANINSLENLKGKKVLYYREGNAVPTLMMDKLLEKAGMSADDFHAIKFTGDGDLYNAIQSRQADVGLWGGTLHHPPHHEFDTQVEMKIVPIAKELLEEVAAELGPMVQVVEIPPGTFKNDNEPRYMFANPTAFLTMADTPDGLVRQVLEYMYSPKYRQAFEASHAQAVNFTLESAVTPQPAPFHPASIEFFKEMGVWTDELQAHNDALLNQ